MLLIPIPNGDLRDLGDIRDLHSVQHEFGDVIAATNYVHHGKWCLETAFCEGPAEAVRGPVYRLRDFDSVARSRDNYSIA